MATTRDKGTTWKGLLLYWDLYWLLFTGLVCWIEFTHQKGCFVQHFVLWVDVSLHPFGTDTGMAGYLFATKAPYLSLASPAHNSSLQWKQYLSRSVLSPLEFTLCQLMIGGQMEKKWMFYSKPPSSGPSGQKWGRSGDRSSAKTVIFLPQIRGRFWDLREISLSTYYRTFVLNDKALLNGSHINQDFRYCGGRGAAYRHTQTFWYLHKQGKR